MKELLEKYQPYPVVDLPDRQWPSRQLKKSPIWCSVDLRDGNQALINPMTLEQKLEMFQLLLDIGFREIEVGFPAASQVEYDFLRKLVEDRLVPDDVTLQVLVQCRKPLIQKTFEALEGVKKSIVHIYNSTSTVQRRVVFGKDRSEIIDIAVKGAMLVNELSKPLKETGSDVMFQYSPESFTGTELDFSLEICEAVIDVWQPTPENKIILNLPATVEMSSPNIYADQIEWFCRNIKQRESVIISVHTHNDRGCGIASSELGLLAGAERVEGTLFGNGERTGNADLFVLGMNLFAHGIDPNLDFRDMDRIIKTYESCCELPVHQRHPYAGSLVYTAFSGSHQDAINKGMKEYQSQQTGTVWEVPYLPIDPQDLGRTYEAIIRINSQSGKGGVAYIMAQEFGYELPKMLHPEFAKVIQAYSDQVQREITPQEIFEQFEKTYLKVQTPFEFDYYSINSLPHTNREESAVQIDAKLFFNQQQLDIQGRGNGPLDALCTGLREIDGIDFRVIDYHEHALGKGSNAKAIAYVQICTNSGQYYFGVGQDTNTTVAPFKALLNAFNRAHATGDFDTSSLKEAEAIS